MVAIRREVLRREVHTICTAVALEEVFTVRTFATHAPYGHPASAHIRTRNTPKPHVNDLRHG